jgi:hypothetical protein
VRKDGSDITDRQVYHLMARIDALLRREFSEKGYHDDSRFADFDRVFSAIATAGAHAQVDDSLSVSIDASDIESWGTNRNHYVKVVDEFGGHQVDDQGELRYEKVKKITDSDARARGSKDPSGKKPMFGYYLTAGVSVRDVDGPEVPRALIAARFRPANYHTKKMALGVAADVAQRRGRLGDVLVDREFTLSNDGDDFLNPVRAMGGEPVFALRENQIGPRGTVLGAIIIDGQPFSPSIPKSLQRIIPPTGKDTDVYRPDPTALAEYQAKIAARSVYALVPNGSRRPNGTMVFQCPGAAGHHVCPLQISFGNLKAGTLPAANPPKSVPSGTVCSSRFRSFEMTELPLYQRDLYGSKKWFKSYSRRGTSIEPHFGALKDEARESFRRGNWRVRGIIKTGLMVAFALASTNRRHAHSFDRAQAKRAASTTPKRTGRPRRQSLTIYQDVMLAAQGRKTEVLLV